MADIRSQMQALEQQAGSGQPPQGSQPQDSGSHEPSAACKAAIVRSANSNLNQFKSIINSRIFPTLNRVDEVANATEAAIPHFREIGVSEETITKIQSDIATLRSSNTVLRSFFQKAITKIDDFLARVNDPNAAFAGIKTALVLETKTRPLKPVII